MGAKLNSTQSSEYFALGMVGASIAGVWIALTAGGPVTLPAALGLAGLAHLLRRGRTGKVNRIASSWKVERTETDSAIVGRRRLLTEENIIAGVTALCLPIATFTVIASYHSESRPLLVFVGLTLLSGATWLLALRLPITTSLAEALLIGQLSVLSAATVLSNMLVFPHLASDPWEHKVMLETLANSGDIGSLVGAYRVFPFFPMFNAGQSMASGLGAEETLIVLCTLMAVASPLAVYSAARARTSPRTALIWSLLLVTSKWWIYWITIPVSMILVVLAFCVLVALVYRSFPARPSLRETALILSLIVFSPFVHPVLSLAGMALCGVSGLSLALSRPRRSIPLFQGPNPLLGLALLAVVVSVARWGLSGSGSFFENIVRQLAEALSSIEGVSLGSSYREPLVLELDLLSFGVLVFLAVLGGLGWLADPARPAWMGSLMATSVFFLAFGFGTTAFTIQPVLPYRWLVFATITMIPASAMAVERISSGRLGLALLVPLLLINSALSYGNTENNQDRPFYGTETTRMFALTDSDLDAVDYICTQTPSQLTTDFVLYRVIRTCSASGVVRYWTVAQFESIRGLFIFRKLYETRRALLGDPSLSYSPSVIDSLPFLNKVYDNGTLGVYFRH